MEPQHISPEKRVWIAVYSAALSTQAPGLIDLPLHADKCAKAAELAVERYERWYSDKYAEREAGMELARKLRQ